MGVMEAIPAFIGLLHFVDDDDDDYVGEEIPVMLGKLGAPAIQPCREYLSDQNQGEYARISAGHALAEIGTQHPETRDACVQALISTLEGFRNDNETVNAFTLSFLADLNAAEAAPLAKEILEADRADESVAGDYEDFQISVDLLKERQTPPKYRGIPDSELKNLLYDLSSEKKRSQEKEKKEKKKRKQAKKARKRHKKR